MSGECLLNNTATVEFEILCVTELAKYVGEWVTKKGVSLQCVCVRVCVET